MSWLSSDRLSSGVGGNTAVPDFENWTLELFVAFGEGRSASATIQGTVTYVYGDNPFKIFE